MSNVLPSWLKFNVSTGQMKFTATSGKPGATGTISVGSDGSVSITGGGVTSGGASVKATGNVSISSDGTTAHADSVTLGIPLPGGATAAVELTPGGFVPHPTDPLAPPVPSASATLTLGQKQLEFDIPLTDSFTMDDLFDRDLGGPLADGLLGDAYTKLRHRQRDLGPPASAAPIRPPARG